MASFWSKLQRNTRQTPAADPEAPQNPSLVDDKLGVDADGKAPGGALEQREDELLDDEGRVIPPWHEQVTLRAIFTGACISVLFSIMVLKCVPCIPVVAKVLWHFFQQFHRLGSTSGQQWAKTTATPVTKLLLVVAPDSFCARFALNVAAR